MYLLHTAVHFAQFYTAYIQCQALILFKCSAVTLNVHVKLRGNILTDGGAFVLENPAHTPKLCINNLLPP